jgi:drug/metabolite transporter (DMT)-like permease
VASISSKKMKEKYAVQGVVADQMLWGSFFFIVFAAFHGDVHFQIFAKVTHESWLAVIYLFTIGSILAFSAYMWAVQHAPPAVTASYAYVNPIIALFVGSYLNREKFDSHIVWSCLFIISSVIVVIMDSQNIPIRLYRKKIS